MNTDVSQRGGPACMVAVMHKSLQVVQIVLKSFPAQLKALPSRMGCFQLPFCAWRVCRSPRVMAVPSEWNIYQRVWDFVFSGICSVQLASYAKHIAGNVFLPSRACYLVGDWFLVRS